MRNTAPPKTYTACVLLALRTVSPGFFVRSLGDEMHAKAHSKMFRKRETLESVRSRRRSRRREDKLKNEAAQRSNEETQAFITQWVAAEEESQKKAAKGRRRTVRIEGFVGGEPSCQMSIRDIPQTTGC